MENSLENGLDDLSNGKSKYDKVLEKYNQDEEEKCLDFEDIIETIKNYPVEKKLEVIKKYRLDYLDSYCENVVENKGVYLKPLQSLLEIRNEFLSILDKQDIKIEIEKLKKRINIKDRDFIDFITECSLVRDKGFHSQCDDDLYYTFFMSLENCRKYIFETMGYIQVFGKEGLYNVNSKTLDSYRKSKDILKRIKVLQIKISGDKEVYSFNSLDKLYFIDDENKNYLLTWNPNKNKFYQERKIDYFNEYNPIQFQGIDHGKDLSLIYYHIKHYLCSDKEDVYNYFISVISDMIRNPGRKLPICIVMNGEGGVGKSFLFDKLFRKLFGDMYGCRSNKISGKFNKELENKICFVIEELSHQDNKNESNIIKDMVSNPKIRIERKGIDSYEIENCIRFFICSNGEWSVRIENNNSSRRYLVCDVSEEIPKPDHFEKLSELIKGDKRKGYEDENILTETIEQFIFDMGKIDLSILETDPPETESKKVSQSFSKSIPEKQLLSFLECIIQNDGNFGIIEILNINNESNVSSNSFWESFVFFLKDRRQQIPESFVHYGRILSKWFGDEFSKRNTKIINGNRDYNYKFPKIEIVESILSIL